MRTTSPDVFAVGDLVATPQLAHVGFAEGSLVDEADPGRARLPDQLRGRALVHLLPSRGGLCRQDRGGGRRAEGFDIVVQKDPYGGNGRARILGETEGLVKVIAERGPDGRCQEGLLGVHMVGPWVTEQLGQAYLSVNWEATCTRSRNTSNRTRRFLKPLARRCSH